MMAALLPYRWFVVLGGYAVLLLALWSAHATIDDQERGLREMDRQIVEMQLQIESLEALNTSLEDKQKAAEKTIQALGKTTQQVLAKKRSDKVDNTLEAIAQRGQETAKELRALWSQQ